MKTERLIEKLRESNKHGYVTLIEEEAKEIIKRLNFVKYITVIFIDFIGNTKEKGE